MTIRDYLKTKGLGYNTSLTAEIEKRKAGKQYTIRDHIRGMIYALLTNQTKWYRVEPHLPKIDKLFLTMIRKRFSASNLIIIAKGFSL